MMVRRLSLPVVACLLTGLAGVPSLRAQAPEPAKTDTLPPLTVEVVRIDVVVTGKGGRARAGLGRDDFVVLEDGQPQTLVQFEAYARPERGAPPVPSPSAGVEADEAADSSPTRHVVLVIDDVHLEFSSLLRAQKALTRFLEEDLEPDDQVALVTTSGGRALAEEFTADRAVLLQALSRLSAQDRRSEWSGVPQMSEYQAELIEGGDPVALDAAVQEVMQNTVYQDQPTAEEISRRKAHTVFAEAVHNSRLTLETLESLTRGLGGIPGRKLIFLVSDGFLPGLAGHSGAAFDIRRITDAGKRAGVVLYALDTRGLVAPVSGGSAASRMRVLPGTFSLIDSMRGRSDEAMKDAMNALAADTGGFLADNSNNLRAGLRRMLKDTETYYVLAYEPTNTKRDGAFRRIEVRLPGVRDVKVRTRSGYFAPDDRRAARGERAPEAGPGPTEPPAPGMSTALESLAPLTAIPVRLSADFVSLEAGVPRVVVSGNVDVTTLPFVRQGDRHHVTLETAAAVYDETGAVAATLGTERVAMDLTDADHDQVLKEGLPYQKTATLRPGRYQVRLAARDGAAGTTGSAWQWVQIPDLAPGRLTLSSLFLLKEGGEAGGAPPGPEAALDLRNAQALRRFRRDENLYVQLYAYNPKRDATGATSLVSQAEILRGGVLQGTAAAEPMAQGEPQGPPVPHTSRIKLQSLEPGDYELRVTVTDQNANDVATRRVSFTVD
jgi:VWFA-related protein